MTNDERDKAIRAGVDNLLAGRKLVDDPTHWQIMLDHFAAMTRALVADLKRIEHGRNN